MTAPVPNYPGIQAAHIAIHTALDDNAAGLNDHLVVGLCPEARLRSRICDVRFVGEQPLRLRVVVSKVHEGEYLVRGSIVKGPGE